MERFAERSLIQQKKDQAVLDSMEFFNERFIDDGVEGNFSLEWDRNDKRYIMTFREL